jgi:AraC-like DNA-binding protein
MVREQIITNTKSTSNRLIHLLNSLTSTGQDERCLRAPKTSSSHGVTLLRVSEFVPREPVFYEPSAVFVLQGSKHGFVGDKSVVYDAKNYLVLSVPLPFECETQATPECPMLAIYVHMRREVIAELLTSMRWDNKAPHLPPATIEAASLDEKMSENLLRLLDAWRSPREWMVLGPQLVREITYRVLTGPQGHGLRALVNSDGHFTQISRVLQRIHSTYAEPLSVSELASNAGMSPSVFHLHFRAVTSTSPMQYIKAIRLHRARTLMRYEGVSASVAAVRVGYESPSQFGREFKRMFGHSPGTEVACFRLARGGQRGAAELYPDGAGHRLETVNQSH